MRNQPEVSPELNQFIKLQDPSSLARRGFLKGSLCTFVLPALSSLGLVSCGGSRFVAPTPRLTSVNNFRDVAGANDQEAYSTSSGLKLNRGVIYRSNFLVPSAADLETLNTLNLQVDHDLRTPAEIAAHPDTSLPGTRYQNINLQGTPANPTPVLNSIADAVSYMENSYIAFVTDSGRRARLAQVFENLATTSGPQVYHCSGGKDRTGWVTTILLTILGVPQDVIVQDYLLTNVYSEASIQLSYEQMVTTNGKSIADIYFPLFIADQRYLFASLNQVATSYGTMTSYINDGLGLRPIVQRQLRDKFLT